MDNRHWAINTAYEMAVTLRSLVARGLVKRRPVYHAHIRKSGGTSLNQTFLSLLGGDPVESYRRLSSAFDHRIIRRDGMTVVGWNRRLLQEGHYFYGFSHWPLHDISVPGSCFTVTVLRDPVERVLSHYRMLLEMRAENSKHPAFAVERSWLGQGFGDFLARIPKEHLLNQLWMFSPNLEPEEGVERLGAIDAVLFTRQLARGIQELGRRLDLPLVSRHVRSTSVSFRPDQDELAHLQGLLEPEYRMLARLEARRT